MAESAFVWGTGRRKSSIARVRIRPGSGAVVVNGRTLKEYFPNDEWMSSAIAPLKAVGKAEGFDVFASVQGGGLTGQAGAVSLGISRALARMDRETHYLTLRKEGLMTRDSRMKERKKYGRRGARRSFQFSKR